MALKLNEILSIISQLIQFGRPYPSLRRGYYVYAFQYRTEATAAPPHTIMIQYQELEVYLTPLSRLS